MTDQVVGPRRRFVELLGGFRAEQLEGQNRLYEAFAAPQFMAELETERNCVLVGGRGTGKTTVLKGLSYQGQCELRGAASPAQLPFLGLYLRINTNRVTAFSGPELDAATWKRVFGHYVNLLLVEQLAIVALEIDEGLTLSADTMALISTSLSSDAVTSLRGLSELVQRRQIELEVAVNNVTDAPPRNISIQGGPIDLLAEALLATPALEGKQIFFLVDEYENLSAPQQEVFNTLIKHAGVHYSFKIGVKRLGLHTRHTMAPDEVLSYPADYEEIDIVERLHAEGFEEFASAVFDARLREVDVVEGGVRALFPDLAIEDEAVLLGADVAARDVRQQVLGGLSAFELEAFDSLSSLEVYAIRYFAEAEGRAVEDVAHDALQSTTRWASRIDNYRYAMLFSIRRGKRGLRKYYAGWGTICLLAGGNIRYLLQLVNEMVLSVDTEDLEVGSISPEAQTNAARAVGERNLNDLAGIAREGSSLAKVVLGLGRVLGVMASRPEGHTPEVNQFALTEGANGLAQRATLLLDACVQHQALVAFAGNKLAAESGETRTSNYSLHPIFAPFFEYSHRKKRKMWLEPKELVGFVDSPRQTIRAILRKTKRDRYLDEDPLSDQLSLFSDFFDGVP